MMEYSYLLVVILLTSCHHYFALNTEGPSRKLHHGGIVKGQQRKFSIDSSREIFVDEFLGIPFAEPPLGDKRFARPIRHPGWSGTKMTVTRPPACWQYMTGPFENANGGARMWINNTEMNEDCLYLNVWKPSDANEMSSLTVMVWIYGGGYTTGSSTLAVYDGTVLAATQNVVVVSMQYRLGAFGFLRLDPTSSDEHDEYSSSALGNQGLWDQLLALKWVVNNVKMFGGDPKKITLFGESSGAVSASVLWMSPLARPFIKRLILQSGSVLARWAFHDLEEAQRRADVFVSACGCPSPRKNRIHSLKCLQSVSPMDLFNNLYSVTEFVGKRRYEQMKVEQPNAPEDLLLNWASHAQMYFDVPFKLVVDAELIPRPPEILIEELGNPSNSGISEVIIGVNQNEAMYFLLYGLAMTNVSFLQPNGQVILPDVLTLAGKKEPLFINGSVADFHLIARAMILDEYHFRNGLSQLPAFFYGLPFEPVVDYEPDKGYASPENLILSASEILKKLDALAGDLDFVCPTLAFAGQIGQFSRSKVYLYSFQRRTESFPFPSWTGVMHGYEIEYFFGMPHSQEFQREFYSFNSEERLFSDQLMRLWANFAKRGNPNQNDDGSLIYPIWPTYRSHVNESRDDYLILDTKFRTAKQLKSDECRFWLHQMPELSHIFSNSSKILRMDVALPILGLLFLCIFEQFLSK